MEDKLAKGVYTQLERIINNQEATLVDKTKGVRQLFEVFFSEVTKAERLQFSTLFTRIAYVSHKYHLNKQLQYFLHAFRLGTTAVQKKEEEELTQIFQIGCKALAEAVWGIWNINIPSSLANVLPLQWPKSYKNASIKERYPYTKAVVLDIDEDKKQLVFKDDRHADELLRCQYGIPDRNENFNQTIKALQLFPYPINVTFLDSNVDEDNVYSPRAFVIEPDYLVDVSAVAETFRTKEGNPWLNLLKKFTPMPSTTYLMIGNIANFFLDELVNNPAITFGELKQQIFKLNPLAFCQFDNRQIKEIVQKCQQHFLTLKMMVTSGFEEQEINKSDIYLEPSFYSSRYGLQGRLDIFHQPAQGETAIVELKSGKPFMTNAYGLSNNHYMQTLLYELLIRSSFGDGINPTNYILYSGQVESPLRFAPVSRAHQYDGLQLRNQLVAIEKMLSLIFAHQEDFVLKGQQILGKLTPQNFPSIKGFIRDDLGAFEGTFSKMNAVEKKYFIAYLGFIAREHELAKIGVKNRESNNGRAALWLESIESKSEAFAILSHLIIVENEAQADKPIIRLAKSEFSNKLANFRKGDIAVFYPHEEGSSALDNQIFKCSIIGIDNEHITIRLRYKQSNLRFFQQYKFWNLEHDMLDSSFNGMYRGLFAFNDFSASKKELLLTTRAPHLPLEQEIARPAGVTAEQHQVLQKAIAAQDYFLLWGPPGTGKTSVFIKELVRYLLDNTAQNILLLAYTNRAVDEICSSIESIKEGITNDYLRIGSSDSTDSRYKKQLLNENLSAIQTRKELIALIQSKRIFASTVSSLAGKGQLLDIKQFDIVIIDEASQILEPMLVGLLPHFKKFVLIGDHLQLPAVVTQSTEDSAVVDNDLHQIGLINMRNSLFERLYKRCMEKEWDWAYARLSHQGRMHQELMEFPNQFFYKGFLNILPQEISHSQIQQKDKEWHNIITDNQQALTASRTLFMHTPIDVSTSAQKTNTYEAQVAAVIVQTFYDIYQQNEATFHAGTIGIITPYRAQIATIRQELETQCPQFYNQITVDTVERYQGGARDIIILSLCTNSINQLEMLSSLSDEGVDRKLNVALTRARKQIIVLGNKYILEHSEVYNHLIEAYECIETE